MSGFTETHKPCGFIPDGEACHCTNARSSVEGAGGPSIPIDHTLLRADATPDDIEKLCREAICHDFYAVCVNSCYAALANRLLDGSKTRLACVVGFPLGAMATEAKAFEARFCFDNGADEIDMVANIGAIKCGDDDFVFDDIKAVVDASDAAVKVIIETCLLTDEEKERVCRLAVRAGAAFVKTSTGFSTGGATIADVTLMRRVVDDECALMGLPKIGVKASGGIKTRADYDAMTSAGATRIGTSNGIAIFSGGEGGGY